MTTTHTDLAQYDNSWYRPGNRLKILVWYFVNACVLNSSLFPVSGLKVALLRLFGARIGRGVCIKPKVSIKYPWLLTVGNNVWIGENAWIDNLARVTIGDNVCISQGAYLCCGNHNYKKRGFDLMIGEITLREGCWVCAGAKVCPGVTIGENAILGVGGVTSKDLDPRGIYRGNPAVKVGERTFERESAQPTDQEAQ